MEHIEKDQRSHNMNKGRRKTGKKKEANYHRWIDSSSPAESFWLVARVVRRRDDDTVAHQFAGHIQHKASHHLVLE